MQQHSIRNNYCDYDAIVHYKPGEFSSRYRTILTGKCIPAEISERLKEDDIKTFANREFCFVKTIAPVILYRVFGRALISKTSDENTKGAWMGGRYASTEFAESMIDAKLRLALDPSWWNTKMYEAKICVPCDQTLIVGVVGSVELKTGTILPGGADQILLPVNWPEEWIIGYRRLTSRQLQLVPKYRLPKPPEFAMKASSNYAFSNVLYRQVCPMCCSENIRALEKEEQFLITGSRGGQYIMKFTCLEKDCLYYW